jgi:hypothetical protein
VRSECGAMVAQQANGNPGPALPQTQRTKTLAIIRRDAPVSTVTPRDNGPSVIPLSCCVCVSSPVASSVH